MEKQRGVFKNDDVKGIKMFKAKRRWQNDMAERDERTKLKKRLFVSKKSGVRMTGEQITRFLQLAAKSRIHLTHYTSLEALKRILENGRLLLTRADKMNDAKEFAGWNRRKKKTYILSFAATRRECVAMWWMYGLSGKETKAARVPVQLIFKGSSIRKALEKVDMDVRGVLWEKDKRGRNKAVLTPPLKANNVAFYDVLYLSGRVRDAKKKAGQGGPLGCVFWNGNQASRLACEDGARHLGGYVKDSGWEYEGETRIAIELSQSVDCRHLVQLSIPFEAAFEGLKVRVGPGKYRKRWFGAVCNALCNPRKHGRILERNNILQSEYEITFRGAIKRDDAEEA